MSLSTSLTSHRTWSEPEAVPRIHSRSRWQKRAFDLVLLLPTLPFFVPVTLVIALVAKSKHGGPVFFFQERVTTGGHSFQICKLRTMSTEDDVTKRKPTKLGQWLRLRGLDELPQLYNVLKGEMSLVGPRPLLRADIERLEKIEPRFAERLEIPPGLTGLSQVCLATGAATTAALDIHYAQTRTAALDLGILMRTVWMNMVGKKRGARRLEDVQLKAATGHEKTHAKTKVNSRMILSTSKRRAGISNDIRR